MCISTSSREKSQSLFENSRIGSLYPTKDIGFCFSRRFSNYKSVLFSLGPACVYFEMKISEIDVIKKQMIYVSSVAQKAL